MENRELYFDFLVQKIGGIFPNGQHEKSYKLLLKTLFDIPFTPVLEMDWNRYSDALDLYRDFSYDHSILFSKPSFLELLVSLAIRIETQFMRSIEFGDRTPVWFWEMISNLGFMQYDDQNFLNDAELQIGFVANRVIDRTFEADGSGGLFPIQRPMRDQRTIEIWSQLNDYLNERI